MKRLFLILIAGLLMLSSCNVKPKEYITMPSKNLIAQTEYFETLDQQHISREIDWVYPPPNEEKAYADEADVIVVGYPVNTFTDEQMQYYDRQRNEVTQNDDWYTMDTIRKIKVVEVLKGEEVGEFINLQVEETYFPNENGVIQLYETHFTDFIQKQNVKYMFYLKELSTFLGEKTYKNIISAGVNIDGLHQQSLNKINRSLFADIIINRYDLFKKYNRSDELEYVYDQNKVYSPDYYTSFECEDEAYAYSDLVIMGTPKYDLQDDKIVNENGQEIDLNEAGQFPFGDVVTLRDITVEKILKGDKSLKDVFIATGHHYYYSIHSMQVELHRSHEISNYEPIWEKGACYIYYLKRDEKLGENAYRISGTHCVLQVYPKMVSDASSSRIYGMYKRLF